MEFFNKVDRILINALMVTVIVFVVSSGLVVAEAFKIMSDKGML
ncbi:hypothetical protein [Vibrio phage vB_VpaP_SJSY21]|nr:hypothetical protein [Vibrio phage vB_VpaP_SJSY21]